MDSHTDQSDSQYSSDTACQTDKPRRTKSRSGCLTCKSRRLKCGEEKPFCQRCLSTGRQCEGYRPVPPLKSTTRRSKYEVEVTLPKRALTNSYLLDSDCRSADAQSLGYFFHSISTSVLGQFEAQIWRKLLPMIGYEEPAVRCALMCLSCIHGRCGRPDDTPNSTQTGLKYYNMSIQALTRLPSSSSCIVLLTCIIFIWIEYLQGNVQKALLHIDSGLHIVSDQFQDLVHDDTSQQLVGLFTKLYTQGVLHGFLHSSPSSSHRPLCRWPSTTSIPRSGDLNSLQLELDSILGSAFPAFAQVPSSESTSVSTLKSAYLDRLRSWHQLFQSFTSISTSFDRAQQVTIHELELQYLLSLITILTIAAHSPTMCYDNHQTEFGRMLALSGQLIALRSITNNEHDQRHRHQTPKQSPPPFTPPLLAPLFYLLLKCRDGRIRREALRLAQQCPEHDGIWDREVLVSFGRWKMATEERLAGAGDVSVFVPEHARIYGERPRSAQVKGVEKVIMRFKRRAFMATDEVDREMRNGDGPHSSFMEVEEDQITNLSLVTVEMAALLGS